MRDLVLQLRESLGLGKEFSVKVSNPKVTGTITVYPDASGAPALLTYNGFTFAYDMLGKVTRNRTSHVHGKERRQARAIAISTLDKAYDELLKKHADADWLARNKKMYE